MSQKALLEKTKNYIPKVAIVRLQDQEAHHYYRRQPHPCEAGEAKNEDIKRVGEESGKRDLNMSVDVNPFFGSFRQPDCSLVEKEEEKDTRNIPKINRTASLIHDCKLNSAIGGGYGERIGSVEKRSLSMSRNGLSVQEEKWSIDGSGDWRKEFFCRSDAWGDHWTIIDKKASDLAVRVGALSTTKSGDVAGFYFGSALSRRPTSCDRPDVTLRKSSFQGSDKSNQHRHESLRTITEHSRKQAGKIATGEPNHIVTCHGESEKDKKKAALGLASEYEVKGRKDDSRVPYLGQSWVFSPRTVRGDSAPRYAAAVGESGPIFSDDSKRGQRPTIRYP
ncbi:hypothetical protein C8J56DRAFT_1029738 [Mycena floridula]|nr:hypothetical protein C8J56DRAFT_1029738 [Mycena floridula]